MKSQWVKVMAVLIYIGIIVGFYQISVVMIGNDEMFGNAPPYFVYVWLLNMGLYFGWVGINLFKSLLREAA